MLFRKWFNIFIYNLFFELWKFCQCPSSMIKRFKIWELKTWTNLIRWSSPPDNEGIVRFKVKYPRFNLTAFEIKRSTCCIENERFFLFSFFKFFIQLKTCIKSKRSILSSERLSQIFGDRFRIFRHYTRDSFFQNIILQCYFKLSHYWFSGYNSIIPCCSSLKLHIKLVTADEAAKCQSHKLCKGSDIAAFYHSF